MVAEGGGKWTWHGHGSTGSNRRVSPALDLSFLSLAEKDALILAQAEQLSAQAAQIAALLAQIAALEAKLGQPPKTPANSSLPPSQGEKPNRRERRAKRRQSHPGVARALAADPDHVVEAYAESCPHCAHALSQADQPEMVMHDHIELPPIRPVITRVHRHRGLCPVLPGTVVRAGRPPARHPGDRL